MNKRPTSLTLDPLTIAALAELATDFEGNRSQAARKAIRDAAIRRSVRLEAQSPEARERAERVTA